MRKTASSINNAKIQEIPGQQEFIYRAQYDETDKRINENDYPCEFSLKLKVGALVLMLVNNQNRRWVNGTLGIVSSLEQDRISVTIDAVEYDIPVYPFSKIKYNYNREQNLLETVEEATVIQYPIVLAYAITIHKSQGLTYQSIACNLNNCFAPGQGYVASL